MFQWAVLVTHRVATLHDENKEHVLNEIKKTPPDLGDLYQDMLAPLLLKGRETDRELALRILRWVLFARDPLTLKQLRYAVTVNPNGSIISRGDSEILVHWFKDDSEICRRIERLTQAWLGRIL